MKIALIMVKGETYTFKKLPFIIKGRPDSLTLPMLYSIIHKTFPDIEIDIYDETFEKINREKIEADLIGISAITPVYYKAVELSRYFRSKNIPVFIGGSHASLVPEDCVDEFDSVISGLANESLIELINDFKNNSLKKIYRQSPDMSFEHFVLPQRDLYRDKYLFSREVNMVQATYGCSNVCKFCVQPYICNGYHQRPVNDVLDEIRSIRSRMIEFVDPNFAKDMNYLKNICAGLKIMRKKWFAPMTILVANNEETLRMLSKSGCQGVLIGFESISPNSIDSINKGFNNIEKYKTAVSEFHKHGIRVTGSFVLGLDGDTKDTVKNLLKFINEAKIDIVRFTIDTPFPGTAHYKEMKEAGRILTDDLKYYDCRHCVIKPANLTPKETEKMFKKLWKKSYSLINITRRLSYIKPLSKRIIAIIGIYIVGKLLVSVQTKNKFKIRYEKQ